MYATTLTKDMEDMINSMYAKDITNSLGEWKKLFATYMIATNVVYRKFKQEPRKVLLADITLPIFFSDEGPVK